MEEMRRAREREREDVLQDLRVLILHAGLADPVDVNRDDVRF